MQTALSTYRQKARAQWYVIWCCLLHPNHIYWPSSRVDGLHDLGRICSEIVVTREGLCRQTYTYMNECAVTSMIDTLLCIVVTSSILDWDASGFESNSMFCGTTVGSLLQLSWMPGENMLSYIRKCSPQRTALSPNKALSPNTGFLKGLCPLVS